MDRFERQILRNYVLRALEKQIRHERRPSGSLASWLLHSVYALGLPEPKLADDEVDHSSHRIDRETWVAFKPLMVRLKSKMPAAKLSGLEERLVWVCETLGLTEIESDILKFSVRFAMHSHVTSLLGAMDGAPSFRSTDYFNISNICDLTGLRGSSVRLALLPNRALLMLGLLEDRLGGDFAASRTILRIARLPTTNPDRLRALLTGKSKKATLAWKDFAHLGEQAEVAERLIAGALSAKAHGVNLLLYGPPGTGKTEFARTLSKRIGAHVSFVGETDDSNEEPTRKERIAAFALARSLARRAGDGVLVVDEADDIFTGVDDDDGDAKVGSKVFMNRLVERTEAPTIWITNHPDRLGAAVLRRMTMAIRFPSPSRAVRRRVAGRIAVRHKLEFQPLALDSLAAINAPPAILENAIRAAALMDGNDETVRAVAQSVLQVMEGPKPPQALKGVIAFDPVLSSADHDLTALADRVALTGEKAISFCLHGPPGTGKSAFARFVAERMDMEVVEKRASDLLSMWVGETEQKIARAFQEAADCHSMLIIDEADSLLRDRATARQSWQVTQVNEMLTWMERHPYPVAFTTNLMDSLDPATLRRFLFKVRFLPMSPEQIGIAFERAFREQAPRELLTLNALTPGDFALVGRKARLMGVGSRSEIAAMLVAEVAAKPGASLSRIGF